MVAHSLKDSARRRAGRHWTRARGACSSACAGIGTRAASFKAGEGPGRLCCVTSELFGLLPDGTRVASWTLENAAGVRVRLIDFGAAIVSIEVPDRDGRTADVALGFDTLDGYVGHRGCLGAVVGRFANRIAHARFSLDGRDYQLRPRGGAHHLHGGPDGFDRVTWRGEWVTPGSAVRFVRRSPDGEEGYPGNCDVSVTYALGDDAALTVDYVATTDAPTPLNLSQHTYFNLAGHDSATILDHELTLVAGHFTPVDDTLIPTGEVRGVDGSAFDFRRPVRIGARIESGDRQLRIAGGYDHNFVIDRTRSGLEPAARVHDPATGRTLEVLTTDPGVQFYTGNFLDGSQVGKGGHAYQRRSGFCLETQHFPDSPNQLSFPDTILRPGRRFASTTVFRFTAT
ncbi:MAG: galactose mutarotase [Acidobacteria bacterium]|nr:galactose mutarotase [Acidobacteriota bacterium]